MTCLAMTTPCHIQPTTLASGFDKWRRDRLTEARGILSHTARHPSSLVIIAARVVIDMTGNSAECAEAIDILHACDPRPLHANAVADCPNGGAA